MFEVIILQTKEVDVPRLITVYDEVDGGWSWVKYNSGPYVGCAYGCSYCFNLSDSDIVAVKRDAVERFAKELANLPKDVISLGDYQPLEEELHLIRAQLRQVATRGFPLHMIEKSPLVTGDLDIIKEIRQNSWAAVSISVTGAPSRPAAEDARRIFEPGTADTNARFAAMAEIAAAGVLTGAYYVPLIPYINDDSDLLSETAAAVKKAGGEYLIIGALNIPAPFDQEFWRSLSDGYPETTDKLRKLYDYRNQEDFITYLYDMETKVKNICETYGLLNYIPRPTEHYPVDVRENKKLAEHFYLAARFAPPNRDPESGAAAYRALACLLDKLDYNLSAKYKEEGIKALEVLGLKKFLVKELEALLQDIS